MHTNGDRRQRILLLEKCLEEFANARLELVLQLEDLDARTKSVQREQNALLNLDAPTSKLPGEILAMVFESGMGLVEPEHRCYGTRYHFGELASHVSRHWRSIALATPRLWKDIGCTRGFWRSLGSGNRDSSGWCASNSWKEKAADYLCRSRSSPVSIHIRGLREEDFTPDFVRLISDHMGHCRHLLIEHIPGVIYPVLIGSLFVSRVPLLSSIGMSFEDDIELQEAFLPLGAPALKTAYLDAAKPLSLHFCMPAFASLTSLRLGGILIEDQLTYDSFRTNIMGLKSLNHLEVGLESFHRPPTKLQDKIIVLPTVKFLRIEAVEDLSVVNNFLEFIQTASLISLSLDGWDSDLAGSMQLYFPTLQHLILFGRSFSIDIEELGEIALLFPSIQRLTSQMGIHEMCCDLETILFVVFGDGIIGEAEYRECNWSPWPNLQTIAVSGYHDDSPSLTRLVRFLRNAGHPLCNLLMSESVVHAVGSEAMEELEELVEISDFAEDWPAPFAQGRIDTRTSSLMPRRTRN